MFARVDVGLSPSLVPLPPRLARGKSEKSTELRVAYTDDIRLQVAEVSCLLP